jgi:hypothetical protein
MAKSYYSMTLDHPAALVWAAIRPFGHYAWAGVEGETVIEDGKADDQVAAIRRVTTANGVIRQVLLAHSDIDRSYTYGFCGESPYPVRNYIATIHILPIVETNSTFVKWSATFDCAADDQDHWQGYFEKQGFAQWLGALRHHMKRESGQER